MKSKAGSGRGVKSLQVSFSVFFDYPGETVRHPTLVIVGWSNGYVNGLSDSDGLSPSPTCVPSFQSIHCVPGLP